MLENISNGIAARNCEPLINKARSGACIAQRRREFSLGIAFEAILTLLLRAGRCTQRWGGAIGLALLALCHLPAGAQVPASWIVVGNR